MSEQPPIAEKDTGGMGGAVAAFAGAISAMHENLGRLQDKANAADARDIDSARVYLEAAFWKFETVLERHGTARVTSPGGGAR